MSSFGDTTKYYDLRVRKKYEDRGLRKAALFDLLNNEGGDPDRLTQMLGNVNVNCCDDQGRTPLMYTAERHGKYIDILFNQGADPLREDKDGRTALDFASTSDIVKKIMDRTMEM